MGHELPSETDGVTFEIITETEIPKHFKERMVACCITDVFEIVVFAADAQTALRGDGTLVGSLVRP